MLQGFGLQNLAVRTDAGMNNNWLHLAGHSADGDSPAESELATQRLPPDLVSASGVLG
jgi:hypothetical protein